MYSDLEFRIELEPERRLQPDGMASPALDIEQPAVREFDQALDDMLLLQAGVLPGIPGSKFSFAWDSRPAGKEHEPIPPHDYTNYFAEHKVPIAPRGTLMHSHDRLHVRGYKELFSDEEFAGVVQPAAANSLDDEDLERKFTGAIDKFSDNHGIIIKRHELGYSGIRGEMARYVHQHAIDDGRTYLEALIRLADKLAFDEQPLPEASQARFNNLWEKLGFRASEEAFVAEDLAQLQTSRLTLEIVPFDYIAYPLKSDAELPDVTH